MNIIIPLGGIGERFIKQNFILPKPLINALTKPIISWVIESLDIKSSDTLYIIYNSILRNYDFENFIEILYPNINIKFKCVLKL